LAIGNPILVSGLAANVETELCALDFVAGRRALPAGTRNRATSIGPDGVTADDKSAPRIAASEEGVPALFGGVVSLHLINAFATNRTKASMNPPTAVPDITEAGA
jgi:hypothetical protein